MIYYLLPKLEGFIRDIQGKLPNLDFEGKRLALDMLGITVWLDGESVEVTDVIEPEVYQLRCTNNQHSVLRNGSFFTKCVALRYYQDVLLCNRFLLTLFKR